MRELTTDERRLIGHLVEKAALGVDWAALRVEEMNDGGMGSLRLYVRLPTASDRRRFGRRAADCWFVDADGVDVIASLYVDKDGALFELDMWKVNFAPLIRIADSFKDVSA
jgi:hypothetical protein